jgi:hypothetical protein
MTRRPLLVSIAAVALATVAHAQSQAAVKETVLQRVATLPATVNLTKHNGDGVPLKIDGPKHIAGNIAEAYVASYIKTWNKCVDDRCARAEPRIAKLYDGQLVRLVKWNPEKASPMGKDDEIAADAATMRAERAALLDYYKFMVEKEGK